MQQIELYKELLAQVTYQNQLLSRDISIKQNHPINGFSGMQGMNYHHMGQMGAMGYGNQGGLNSSSLSHGMPQNMMGGNSYASSGNMMGMMMGQGRGEMPGKEK